MHIRNSGDLFDESDEIFEMALAERTKATKAREDQTGSNWIQQDMTGYDRVTRVDEWFLA